MNNIFFRKRLYSAAIGVGCLIIGLSYGMLTKDKILIILSVVLVALCIGKIIELYLIEKKKRYEMVAGKCIGNSLGFLARYRNIRIETDEGVVEICVPKNIKLQTGNSYIFYFKEVHSDISEFGNKMKEKILSDNFLGSEEIKTEEIKTE